jgi:hypothetical protein
LTIEFLQQAHSLKLDFSPRDGVNLLRYAIKRMSQDPNHPISRDQAWKEALVQCLGEDAVDLDDLAKRKKQSLGGDLPPLGLGDFFHDPNDPLHPDNVDDDDDDDDDDEE